MPKRDRSSDSNSYSNNRRRHHSPERQVGENLHESATIIDRDGRRHVWRDSKNISERTKNLEVPFRVINIIISSRMYTYHNFLQLRSQEEQFPTARFLLSNGKYGLNT